ncbi:hypothetical protein IAD21_05323 [Abditibacteriota bacterium]|nr:hypothetical protein IAD21_05323 [Abditibacteriota bacterium]
MTLTLLYNLCVFFPDEPVPLEVVRELAALLATNGLSELTLESKGEEDALRLSLERETRVYTAAPVAPESVTTGPVISEESKTATSEASTQTSATQNKATHEVGAPCVGVYRAPKKPLLVGDSVQSGQVIAVVESLHVPNEVPAPFDATILEIPALDGEGVEWGQTLLILEPAS